MGDPSSQPICAQEALDLLNCVTESPLDQEKCYHLLHSLRECVLNKVTISVSLRSHRFLQLIFRNCKHSAWFMLNLLVNLFLLKLFPFSKNKKKRVIFMIEIGEKNK